MNKKIIRVLFVAIFYVQFSHSFAQNVSINILTQNSGIVAVGSNVFVQIDITNTDGTLSVPIYKIKPFLSTPSALVSIPASGHILPTGWAITSNANGVIRFSNGTDVILPNTSRSLLIALKGIAIGGPSTVAGSLVFANGNPPGTVSGPSLPGDNTADNSSTSTIEVINVTPVKLSNFSASLIDCQPALGWTTETESNSSNFEIERASLNPGNWIKIGTVSSQGNSGKQIKYNYRDNNLLTPLQKVFYRLKITDKDGRYNYSQVLLLYNNCKTTQINTYPNPVQNGLLTVNIIAIDNKNTEAVLISPTGQVVLKVNLKNGLNTVNVSNIANGGYLLKVNETNNVNKVLIQSKK